jgi:phosphoribosylamine--glycine ligase
VAAGVDSAGRTAVSFLFLQTHIMKILIIGGGGREHAIAWKLRQSAGVEKIWCAPGNGGISRDAECVPLNVGDVKAAADLAIKLGADLTIVGPELPLVQGIADEFKRRGLAILGPGKVAAQLEGSKVFAKEFMARNEIPTAGVYGTFESAAVACAKLASVAWPVVVKADGLCAGKGVLVTSSATEAKEFIERLMKGDEFGDAGSRVLLEEGIAGKELSYIILTARLIMMRARTPAAWGRIRPTKCCRASLRKKFWRKLFVRRWRDCAKKRWSIEDLFFSG